MKTEMKNKMLASIEGFRMPRYAELPNVGLYLEQTTKYLNHFLTPLGCMEVTTSMISNYVKKGLIPKPIKKQYYVEHLAYLFFVVFAKNLVMIENIGLLIEMQKNTYTLSVAYDYMCCELENQLFYIFGLREETADLGLTDSDEKELFRRLLASVASLIHLNAYFAQLQPPVEKPEKGKKK